jgi:hypothetical protein
MNYFFISRNAFCNQQQTPRLSEKSTENPQKRPAALIIVLFQVFCTTGLTQSPTHAQTPPAPSAPPVSTF